MIIGYMTRTKTNTTTTRNARLGLLLVPAVTMVLCIVGSSCYQKWQHPSTTPSTGIVAEDHRHPQRQWMIRTRNRRHLQETRDVPLFLSLYYLDHERATQLETKDPSNPSVAHLCQSISTQVRFV